jgi:hypothetical protein
VLTEPDPVTARQRVQAVVLVASCRLMMIVLPVDVGA